jgi:deoxyribonuclease IV
MNTLLLGAHCSIEGGLYTAFERAEKIQSNVMQIFTQNARQWKSNPLNIEQVEMYQKIAKKSNIKAVISHDSYLINLCAADANVLLRSREAFEHEIKRCHDLGINILVFHPGSHLGKGEEDGIKIIAESLNLLHEKTRGCNVISTLESTAGQGTNIGYKFEQLRDIIDRVEDKSRIGVCIDTCHIFAAGYEIREEKAYKKTFKAFNDIIGFEYLKAFHLNDSKTDFGSRVDRHDHIGKGYIGKAAFGFILRDRRFSKIPKVIETPKSKDLHEDKINLKLLRKLAVTSIRSRSARTTQ